MYVASLSYIIVGPYCLVLNDICLVSLWKYSTKCCLVSQKYEYSFTDWNDWNSCPYESLSKVLWFFLEVNETTPDISKHDISALQFYSVRISLYTYILHDIMKHLWKTHDRMFHLSLWYSSEGAVYPCFCLHPGGRLIKLLEMSAKKYLITKKNSN